MPAAQIRGQRCRAVSQYGPTNRFLWFEWPPVHYQTSPRSPTIAGMTTILDPTDERVPVRRSLTPRPESITGVVGLLNISKPRGEVLIARLEERLRERLPNVEFRNYAKPTFTKPAPLDLRQKIAEECGFIIEALAD